jgi:carbonic anhydrase
VSDAERDDEFDRMLAENDRYTEAFDRSALTARPLSRLVIVACMDPRLDIEAALGLRTGEAHIIRNAGGLVTDDVLRSLVLSTQLIGTQQIVVIEHTGCALEGLDEADARARVAERAGLAAEDVRMRFGAFGDLKQNIRAQVAILRGHPLLRDVTVRGLRYDVATGRLDEVA